VRRLKASPATDCARLRLLGIALLAAGISSFVFSAAPAGAETVHVYTQTISGNALAGTALNTPKGVAVDGSSGADAGSVYVADSNNNRIVKFNEAGQFQLMFGHNVNEGSGDPNVCTNAGAPTDICKPGSSTAVPGATVGSFGPTQPIVVDSSSGPSAGDIYVVGNTGSGITIQKFDPSGHLVTSYGNGSPFSGSVPVPGNPRSMAIDLAGNIYTFSEGDVVRKWDETGALLATSSPSPRGSYFQFGLAVDAEGNYFQMNNDQYRSIQKISFGGTDLGRIDNAGIGEQGLVYDPTSDELFTSWENYPVSGVHAYRFNVSGEIIQPNSTACAPALTTGCEATETFGTEQMSSDAQSPGIAVNTSNHKLYVADKFAGNVKVFSRIDLPKFTNPATSETTRTSVKFSSHVDPDGGGEVTTCKIEYGATKEYTASVPCAPGSFSSASDVTAAIPSGTLTAGTLYHYRLVAGNANGNRPSSDQTFTTLPAVGGVVTGPANEIKQLTTVLTGSFTGDGVDTSYFFEYGTTSKYGQKTPTVDAGTASGPQAISLTATQLIAYTPYHYRLVAQNSYGTTYGEDLEFLTIPPELPQAERMFTSAVDRDSATVNAEVDTGFGLTLYRFEYGTDTSYGSRALVGGPIDPESPNQTATSVLEELSPGTTYHYRVRLTNFGGTSVGPDATFTTPSQPAIGSTSVSALGQTTATLIASINPGLSPTTYHFDYGTGADYGSSTPESSLGSGGAPQAVSAALSNLRPGTTYHYRVVATNAVGGALSTDQTFTTAAATPAAQSPPASKRCKRGFVKKHGKCMKKKPRRKRKRGKRG
jgi:NHL repeat